MSRPASQIGPEVLEFYRHLPFNIAANPEDMAAEVKATNTLSQYSPLLALVTPGRRVLDIGCGAGWLSNTMAFHQGAQVTGIDFNPVAIDFATRTSEALGLSANFEVANLFEYKPEKPFDVVVSLGVLHHTGDCINAVKAAAGLVRPGGFLFIGLYHAPGRQPFLEHFAQLKQAGQSEEALFEEFRRLFGKQSMDELHTLSWFRDQVLHPHETQHTLREMLPVLDECGMEFLSSSLDDYKRPPDIENLSLKEAELESLARDRLADGEYYSGFFCFLARRPS